MPLTEANLADLRGEWEAGYKPLTVIDLTKERGCVLVILEDTSDTHATRSGRKYHLHRYFKVTIAHEEIEVEPHLRPCMKVSKPIIEWAVSRDGENVSVEEVFSWLNEPSIRSAHPRNRILPTPVPRKGENDEGLVKPRRDAK